VAVDAAPSLAFVTSEPARSVSRSARLAELAPVFGNWTELTRTHRATSGDYIGSQPADDSSRYLDGA